MEDFLEFLSPPKKTRLLDTIVLQIKELIKSQKLVSGQKIGSERELADVLCVSRSVIKQALLSLEQSGLIEIKTGPKGGAYISYDLQKPFQNILQDFLQMGDIEIQQCIEARKAIELYSMRLAVNKSTPDDIQMLYDINSNILDCVEKAEKTCDHNIAFHLAIADISGNRLFKMFLKVLFEFLKPSHGPENLTEQLLMATYERHQYIIKKMSEKNIEECEKLIIADAEHTKDLLDK